MSRPLREERAKNAVWHVFNVKDYCKVFIKDCFASNSFEDPYEIAPEELYLVFDWGRDSHKSKLGMLLFA